MGSTTPAFVRSPRASRVVQTPLGDQGRVLFAALVALCATLFAPLQALAQVPTFNTVVMTPTGSAPWQPPRPAAVGDFDQDGKLDALIVDGSPALHLMRGNGDSTFGRTDFGVASITTSNVVGLAPSLFPYLPNPVDGYGAVKAADVNGDGKLDAICVMTAHINFGPASFITVLTNTGNDANGVPQFTATHYALGFYDVRSLTVGDLNGDGHSDFIVGSAYSGQYVYLNNGDGTFTRSQVTSLVDVNASTGQGAIADVNGDGKADYVVTTNQGAGGTNIFLGNGDGTFQAPVSLPNVYAIALALADMNKDGKPDLVEGFGDGSVSVFLNNGHGTFGSPANFLTVAGGGVSGFFISDVNGDGNLDVAMSLVSAGKVAIVLGNGDGTLGASYLYGGIPNAVDVTLADFTGDGKPEIASVSAAGYGGQNYDVLTNTTVFTLPTQTLTILGGNGNVGDVAANVEYDNPTTGNWQPAYLTGWHPWGFVLGTDSWINYKTAGASDPGAGPTIANTLWYRYRVRFTVPADAINAKMTFSLKADNLAQVAINGASTGPTIAGTADLLNVDAIFSQSVHPGENTITINVGDYGGLNGFNFRIDLSMRSSQPLEIVPAALPDTTPPVITPTITGTLGNNGWYTSNAGVSFTVTDPESAISSSTECDRHSVTSDTAGVTFTCSATSDGGTSTSSVTIKRDATSPTISGSTTPVAAATGWYNASTGAPTVSFTCSDGTSGIASGIASCSGPTTLLVDGAAQGVTGNASDNAGNSAHASVNGINVDLTAPSLTVPVDQTLEATGPDGAPATFAATVTDNIGVTSLTYSTASGSTFPLGPTTVTVTAGDAAGNSSTGSFTITVRDTTPPVITSLTLSSGSLWPPNHRMVAVTLNANATDAVGVASRKIVKVISSEPDNGLGDGDTPNDIQITGDLTVNLRAERSGKGNGRTYTITVEARDAAGNASTKTTPVFVPKSQGK